MGSLNIHKARVKASSILEVTLALIIISGVFGIAATIFVRAEQSAFSARRFAAGVALEKLFDETQSGLRPATDLYETEHYRIMRSTEKFRDKKDLILIKLEAIDDNGKMIAERKFIVYEKVAQ